MDDHQSCGWLISSAKRLIFAIACTYRPACTEELPVGEKQCYCLSGGGIDRGNSDEMTHELLFSKLSKPYRSIYFWRADSLNIMIIFILIGALWHLQHWHKTPFSKTHRLMTEFVVVTKTNRIAAFYIWILSW